MRSIIKDIEEIKRIPKVAPRGKVLIHNHIRPNSRLGYSGFRAYLVDQNDDKYERCTCGWADELPVHYKAKGEPSVWKLRIGRGGGAPLSWRTDQTET